MKKINLLFISLCLFLTGCNKVQSVAFADNTETETTEVDETKKEFPFEEVITYYKEQLKENILVPIYKAASDDHYFDSKYIYNEQFRIYANNTNIDEFNTYKNTLVESGWVIINNELTDGTLKFGKTRAVVDLYNGLDYKQEPYIVIVFSVSQKEYNDLQIIKDVIISQFGFVEDGDILEPDEQGIIKSTKDITWNLKDFTDGEEHTRGEYLIKALHDLLALSINGYFPGYLFYDWYNTPTYNEEQDIAEVYLGTYNLEYVLYMYSHYDDELVIITFMTGPRAAFPHAFEEGE